MNRAEIFNRFGVKLSDEAGMAYSCGQMIRLLVRAKSQGKELVIPSGQNEETLDRFASFLDRCAEAFLNVKKGLDTDWFAAPSLFSDDGKSLYFFLFTKGGAPLMVKGIKNKKTNLTFVPSDKKVEQDKSLGLGEGPGTIWLCLQEKDVDSDCTVIKLSANEKIELYRGTGAPITQN